MKKDNKSETSLILPITPEFVERRIYLIRGTKVMLDSDLAELYQVETRLLIQAVKRNEPRFPSDFLFRLNQNEVISLRSQIEISKKGRGGRRYTPYVFTEHVLVISSTLKRLIDEGSNQRDAIGFVIDSD